MVVAGVIESLIAHSPRVWTFADLVLTTLSMQTTKEVLSRDENGKAVIANFLADERTAYQVFTTVVSRMAYYRSIAGLWQDVPNRLSLREWLADESILLLGVWRLVPHHKAWQKECKKVWDKVVQGEYDWAHLAMHLWPERVIPKCVTDASLAVAHGLDEMFWEQDDRERFQPKDEPEGGWEPVVDRLVKERTSPAVKAALQSLLDAPVPSSSSRRRRRVES